MTAIRSLDASCLSDATTLLLEGQNTYGEKRYEAALEYFNNALAASKSQPSVQLQVLDHLVGVHVKLKQLNDALKNAKLMVRCDRSDARGYLRCGQIQRVQEDLDAACRWYEHGLKNVKADNRLRPTLSTSLEKIKDQAARQRVQSKPCDPATILPLEIIRTVLGYLDYREHVRLLRVSNSWRTLLSSLPPITSTVDFKVVSKPISRKMASAAVRRLTNYPTTVVLASLTESAAQYLNDRLQLWSTRPMTRYVEIFDPRIIVNKIRWRDLPLRSLELGPSIHLGSAEIWSIMSSCYSLETLIIEGPTPTLSAWVPPASETTFVQTNLKTLVLCTHILFDTLAFLPNLAKLKYHWTYQHLQIHQMDLSANSKLIELDLKAPGLDVMVPKQVETVKACSPAAFIFNGGSTIRRLELKCCSESLREYSRLVMEDVLNTVTTFSMEFDHNRGDFEQANLDHVFNNCSSFEHIRFKTNLLKDSDFGNLVGTTPKLRSLIIEDAPITGAFLADLFKSKSCRIESIALRRCTEVSSDTWDWIRARGVYVDVKNASERRDDSGARRLVDLR